MYVADSKRLTSAGARKIMATAIGKAQEAGILARPGEVAIVPDMLRHGDGGGQAAGIARQAPHDGPPAGPVVGGLGQGAFLVERLVRHAR